MRFVPSTPPLVQLAILTLALGVVSSPASAQRRAATVRRGAPSAAAAPAPTAEATITVGSSRYAGSVDANCTLDERSTPTNGRFYYHIMYPWFGARPAPGQPQWRFSLDLRRPTRANAFEHFVFSFLDGTKGGTIQKLPGAEKMGGGTVRVTPHGDGARFDVVGRSKEGDAIRATIDCASFPKSEGAGG